MAGDPGVPLVSLALPPANFRQPFGLKSDRHPIARGSITCARTHQKTDQRSRILDSCRKRFVWRHGIMLPSCSRREVRWSVRRTPRNRHPEKLSSAPTPGAEIQAPPGSSGWRRKSSIRASGSAFSSAVSSASSTATFLPIREGPPWDFREDFGEAHAWRFEALNRFSTPAFSARRMDF